MTLPRSGRGFTAVALAAITGLTLTGCGDDAPAGGASGDTWQAVAAFYPLQYVTERVGGDLVTVTNLTKPGAEPHDLELAPQDLGALSEGDLTVYLEGFQPAVDAAVEQTASGQILEVSEAADLSLTYVVEEHGDEEEHSDDEEQIDPHFWLDPTRLADVGDAVATSLSRVDPAAQATFEANAAELRADLSALDKKFSQALQTCDHRELVTSHNAFGYLADAYDLEQVGITGLTPDTEPNPQDLADVTDYVNANDVQTIYYETLVSPDVAQTIAEATGANTDVLDPIEGLSDSSLGNDYVEIMEANLTNLTAGLACR